MTEPPSERPPTGGRTPLQIRLAGRGLILREWADDDLPAMIALFDDPDVDRFTPLHAPFDLPAARAYLDLARQRRRAESRIQLAITTDGHAPLGEILCFSADTGPDDAELAYAIGPQHRRQHLAVRAVRLITQYAYTTLGMRRVLLRIPEENTASKALAQAAGFHLTDAPPTTRHGAQDSLLTWQHLPDQTGLLRTE